MRRAVLQPINDVEDKAGLIYLYSLLKELEPPKKSTRITEEHHSTDASIPSLLEPLTQKESEVSELGPCPSQHLHQWLRYFEKGLT